MSKKKITIIDYKCGNIFSLVRLIEHKFNFLIEITDDPNKILKAEKIILPGVGSFKVGIENIKKNNIDKSINDFLKTGNHLLGICLGMQLLMNKSEEFGEHKGMGLISGDVKKIEKAIDYPVPHIGWSQVNNENNNKHFLIDSIKDKSFFYFIHSYKVKTVKVENTVCSTKYGNESFSSVISSNNISGTQFHPEKSGKNGEKMLENFLKI